MLHYDPRAVAHYHRTQCPDQNGHWAYEGQHFWLRGIHTSDRNGNALPAQQISKFPSKFGSWCTWRPTPATARGLGGGDDKLAIDKGGNLPEKVENHWYRRMIWHLLTCAYTVKLNEYIWFKREGVKDQPLAEPHKINKIVVNLIMQKTRNCYHGNLLALMEDSHRNGIVSTFAVSFVALFSKRINFLVYYHDTSPCICHQAIHQATMLYTILWVAAL